MAHMAHSFRSLLFRKLCCSGSSAWLSSAHSDSAPCESVIARRIWSHNCLPGGGNFPSVLPACCLAGTPARCRTFYNNRGQLQRYSQFSSSKAYDGRYSRFCRGSGHSGQKRTSQQRIHSPAWVPLPAWNAHGGLYILESLHSQAFHV